MLYETMRWPPFAMPLAPSPLLSPYRMADLELKRHLVPVVYLHELFMTHCMQNKMIRKSCNNRYETGIMVRTKTDDY